MSYQNQYNEEARRKLKEIAENVRICMFHTRLDVIPINTAPMTLQEVDERGFLWFLGNKKHDTLLYIENPSPVQLSFSNPGSAEFLSIYGNGYTVDDKDKLEELYSDINNTWFDGVDDPNLQAVAVQPIESHYWEPKSNKLITLLKMAYSGATGQSVDVGNQGVLKP